MDLLVAVGAGVGEDRHGIVEVGGLPHRGEDDAAGGDPGEDEFGGPQSPEHLGEVAAAECPDAALRHEQLIVSASHGIEDLRRRALLGQVAVGGDAHER